MSHMLHHDSIVRHLYNVSLPAGLWLESAGGWLPRDHDRLYRVCD